MEKQITLDLINNFSDIYNSNSINRVIENAITENGLEKSCIDRRIIRKINRFLILNYPMGKDMTKKIIIDVGFIVD